MGRDLTIQVGQQDEGQRRNVHHGRQSLIVILCSPR
jgi:hypothetical protein